MEDEGIKRLENLGNGDESQVDLTSGGMSSSMPDKKTPETTEVKRVPVDYDFGALNPAFLTGLAKIAGYASEKYGSALQYANGRLVGEKSPINHAIAHIMLYVQGESHDRFGDVRWHLVAAAYNLMMEHFYCSKWGHLPHPLARESPAGDPLTLGNRIRRSLGPLDDKIAEDLLDRLVTRILRTQKVAKDPARKG